MLQQRTLVGCSRGGRQFGTHHIDHPDATTVSALTAVARMNRPVRMLTFTVATAMAMVQAGLRSIAMVMSNAALQGMTAQSDQQQELQQASHHTISDSSIFNIVQVSTVPSQSC